MSRVPIVYLAHAITAPLMDSKLSWLEHKDDVARVAHEIAIRGCVPIVPEMLGEIEWSEALRLDKRLISVADAIFVHDSSWSSHGVDQEIEWGHERGILVTMDLEELSALHLS